MSPLDILVLESLSSWFSPSSTSPEVLVGIWWSLITLCTQTHKEMTEEQHGMMPFNWIIRTVCSILLLYSSSSQTGCFGAAGAG